MSKYVLDNAVAMAWCFSEENTPYTENLLDRLSSLVDVAVVPSLWLYEVTNVSTMAVRKGRISKDKATEFLAALPNLRIEIEPPRPSAKVFIALSTLMERHRLTGYDAAYLEIAIRRNLPLATFDQALINACKALGRPLV